MADLKQPLVSIIIRTKNRPETLVEAIDSACCQSYPNIEIVVVNDGGNSVQNIVKDFNDLEIPIILKELDSSVGRSAAANVGLDTASGEYLNFLDDDDLLYPFHVEQLLKHLQESRAKVCYSDALRAKQIINSTQERETTSLALSFSETFNRAKLLENNYIPIHCALFHRSCIDDGTRFDESLLVFEDWEFWLQLSGKHKFSHLPAVTCEFSARDDASNIVGENLKLWHDTGARIVARHKDSQRLAQNA